MRPGPPSLRRAVLTALGGALFTAVLWSLVSGDVERGATYGAIVLGVLLATAALERRRGDRPDVAPRARPPRDEPGAQIREQPQVPPAAAKARPKRRQKRRRR